MDKYFAQEKEKNGFEKLLDFNSKLHLQEVAQTPTGAYSDASGITADLRLVNIENKIRNQVYIDNHISGLTKENKSYTANTIYIEAHKIADLLLDWVAEKKEPLYINYLNDDVVIVFNLSRLGHRPKKTHRRIFSKLYQSFEVADREELELADAYIYQKINGTYKLISRP